MYKPHLYIATPMYGGMCCGAYTQSIINLVTACNANGIDVSFSFMFNESLIQRARNGLVHNAMKTNFTHFMFIDSDIRFHAMDIISMMKADKPLIAGIYPKKEINWKQVRRAVTDERENLQNFTGSFVVNLLGNAGEVTVPSNQPLEVMNAGTGFMLIQREVFTTIKEKLDVPEYSNDVVDLSGNLKVTDKITAYFDVSIEEGTNRLLSEDYHFCQLYRKAGGQVFVAPWVKLAHIGTYTFEGGFIPAD